MHSDQGATSFSRLLLATGARPRRLDLASTDEIDVRYLRTLADSTALQERLGAEHHLLILGGGWIGMEVAATARTLGTRVTVVEPAELPLLAALGPDVATRFADVHRAQGVDLRTRTGLDRLEGAVAVLTDGTRIEPDTVLVGIGAVPNVELAADAGLSVDNGVLVDSGLRTSHPAVFAAGDLANAAHPVLGTRIRVEHWQNAISQGRAAAHALLGEPVSYEDLPYFFSDQYDLGMEFFGHARGRPTTSRSSRARATTPSPAGGSATGGWSPRCTSTSGTAATSSGSASRRVPEQVPEPGQLTTRRTTLPVG